METTKSNEKKDGKLPVGQPEDKKRNPSTTFTIKSFKGVIVKMQTLKMITNDEAQNLKELHKKVLNRWIGMELGD